MRLIFSIYLILPAALGPVLYTTALNINEYQTQKNVSVEESAAGEKD
jgi:hypothetical protein